MQKDRQKENTTEANCPEEKGQCSEIVLCGVSVHAVVLWPQRGHSAVKALAACSRGGNVSSKTLPGGSRCVNSCVHGCGLPFKGVGTRDLSLRVELQKLWGLWFSRLARA